MTQARIYPGGHSMCTWEKVYSAHLYGMSYRYQLGWTNVFKICVSLFSVLEKAMAPHSSTLAWKIPWAEEPGRLQSMGSLRVGHDWVTSLSLFTFIHWRRKWQPTPVLLPGESQGRGSLVGCRLWARVESGQDWNDLAAAATVTKFRGMSIKLRKNSTKMTSDVFI